MRDLILSLLASVLLVGAGCAASGPAAGQALNAAANSAVAAGVAGARRADGQCYTPCNPGTACNPKTGYCDTLPCRGECKDTERCDESGVVSRCVAGTELEVRQAPGQARPSEAPRDVPAAGK